MVSQDSPFLDILEKHDNPVREKIQKSLKLLEDFQKRNSGTKLASGTKLTVRTTDIISYNISYAGHRVNTNEGELSVGFLYNDNAGPTCDIKPGIETHNECKDYFKSLYDKGKTIFIWDENGITWDKNGIL